MKLPPATLLVLAMFGSFAIILTVMIVIFRPDPRPIRRKVAQQSASAQVRDTLSVAPVAETRPDTVPAETPEPPATSPKKQPPPIPQSAEAGRRLYRELEREQQEIAQLKADMEKRLKAALAEHNAKLAQLARRSEPLEPGEAAQILNELSDDDIAGVLRRMQPDKAAAIIPVLKRLGREKAVAKMK